MSRPVIVLGAGGHGRVLLDTLAAARLPIEGLVDPDASRHGQLFAGHPVLGADEDVLRYAPAAVFLANGLGSTANTGPRQRLFQHFRERGYDFAQLVHPHAYVAADLVAGAGLQVMAGAVVQPGCRFGANVIVNTRASVDHDCTLGDHVHVAPGVTLSGGVSVGAGTHVGSGATVIQGVTIGEGCLIAAGAVVVQDVPAGMRVLGVPGRARPR